MLSKRIKKIGAWLLTLSLVLGTAVLAAGQTTEIPVVSGMKLVINGQEQKPTNAKGEEIELFSYKEATYVPLRYIAELLGLEVGWDEQNPTDAILNGDVPGAEDEVPEQIPGVYTANATGYGELSVTIKAADGKVTAITIDGSNETPAIGGAAISDHLQPALDALVGTETAKLSFDGVEAVSGASLTSKGVLAAANGALEQIKGGAAAAMVPGVYRASAVGYKDNPGKISNGTMVVTVEVSEDAILSIDVDFARDEFGNILEGNGAYLTEDPLYSDVFEDMPYAYIQTTNYGGFALDILTDRVMDAQTVAVDAVSNATFTSAGFLSAVTDCLEQAGAPSSFFLSGTTVEKQKTLNADVVVIGAGGAGLTAAASALDAGADVILLEKQDFTGGTTASSNAATRVTNSQLFLAATAGMGEDLVGAPDQAELDAYSAARAEDPNAYTSLTWFWFNETKKNNFQGWYDIDLINYVAANGGHFVDWLMETVGVPYSLDKITDLATARSHRPYEVGSNPFNNGSRPLKGYMRAYGLTSNLESFFTDNGGKLMVNTRANQLLTDEKGNVNGVVAVETSYDGKVTTKTTYTINAGAVVMATGGLENNREMAAEFTPQIKYTNSLGARAGDTGDAITMAYYDEAVGAAVQFQGYAPTAGQSGLRNTDALKAAGVATSVSYNTGLKVSLQGNVLDFNGYVQDAGIVALWDDALYNACYEKPTGVWFGLIPGAALNDAARKNADTIEATGLKAVFKADTVDDLIQILVDEDEMDAEALKATIDQWNTTADEALKMEGEGPFYAISIVSSTNGSYGGLKTNNQFQVLRLKDNAADYTSTLTVPEGNYISDDFRTVKYATYDFWKTVDEDKIYEPIGGLYACGEVATSEFYGTIYPSAGTSIGLGVTMGRTAGLEAAAYTLGDAFDYKYIPHSKAIIEDGGNEGVTMGAYYLFTSDGERDEDITLRVKVRPLTGVEPTDAMTIRIGDKEYGKADMNADGVIEVEFTAKKSATAAYLTIDWDGEADAYRTTVYTMDLSGIQWPKPANQGGMMMPPPM